MRNLKIYKQERSSYLIELANKLNCKSKFKEVKEKFGITISEWHSLSGYMNSNDFKDNKKVRTKAKKVNIKKLKKLPYKEYLKSEHWQQIKKEIKRVFKTCVICNSKTNLNVHHRSYRHRGNANKEIRDLILLCSECHTLFHTYGKLKK
jgi:5-methylcytosine-specific restriction endonuclease McrA